MSISVTFQKPIGNILASRDFQPGDQIRIAGQVAGWLGGPDILTPISLDITGYFSSIHVDSKTNLVGNYWFDVILPNVVSGANVTISANRPFPDSRETVIVPIGIGTKAEDVPIPEPEPGFLDQLGTVVKWVVIASGVIAVLYVLSKAGGIGTVRKALARNPRRRSLR